jgi:cytochrome c-type biogenesis protein CcmH
MCDALSALSALRLLMAGLKATALALVTALVLVLGAPLAHAADAPPAADDPVTEARMLAIASELRCLVCQNQTIADSHSGLASDLRQEIRKLLQQGASDQAVRDHMTARYGDFILYRPPVRASTALLWFGPGLLAIGGLIALWLILRRRARLGADAFDPDQPDSTELS